MTTPPTPTLNEMLNPNYSRKVTFDNIKYGIMVEILHEHGGYHSGCKVHFFNKKGVLVGNYYEFMPYEKLRHRDHNFPRYFMGKNYLKKRTPLGERIKTWLFSIVCNIVTGLIKFTQKYMD